VYITKYELKIVLKNLNYLKKKIYPAEFRIQKGEVHIDLNHSHFTMCYKSLEVILIGTDQETENAE